ncbi:MAG: hypothetical protein RLZZ458_55 [Planctomycetota bacterium]|jgi:hypothetical protein
MDVFSNTTKQFLSSEDGFILSSESLLLASITVLGLIVGIASVRDALLLELEDLSGTIGFLNQSYEYAGVGDGDATTEGGTFSDTLDDSDPDPGLGQMISLNDPTLGPDSEQ